MKHRIYISVREDKKLEARLTIDGKPYALHGEGASCIASALAFDRQIDESEVEVLFDNIEAVKRAEDMEVETLEKISRLLSPF